MPHWLYDICEKEDRIYESIRWRSKPYLVTVDGQQWTAATNGRFYVAINELLPEIEPCTPDRDILSREKYPIGDVVVDLPALKAFVGSPLGMHRIECPNCECRVWVDGLFKAYEDKPHVRLFGHVVDLDYLAHGLQHFEDPMAYMEARGQDHMKPFIFDGDDWRVAISPVNFHDSPEDYKDLPEFPASADTVELGADVVDDEAVTLPERK